MAHRLLAKNMQSCMLQLWSFPRKQGIMENAQREKAASWKEGEEKGDKADVSYTFTTVQPSFLKHLWYHWGHGTDTQLKVEMWLLKL